MQKQQDLSTLGCRLRFLRQSAKFTLQELSDKTGISRSNLSKYEKNEVKPTSDAIVSICDFLNVSTDWLLKGTELQTQKDEATDDPELKEMYDILKGLMLSGNRDLRGWAKVQFENAFREHCATKPILGTNVQVNKPHGLLHMYVD